MLVEENSLKLWIENFYGYGSWQAPIWFIGYEDDGGDLPEEVAEKFNWFMSCNTTGLFKPDLYDLRSMYKELTFWVDGQKSERFANRFEHRFGENAVLHGLWKNLIAFAHGYRDERIKDLLSYQKDSFVTQAPAREAWIQLYPLPSPHNHAWYYSWLEMPTQHFLKSRSLYEMYTYPFRIRAILENMQIYRPKLVLMFGMNNINVMKKSILEFFPAARFRMMKAVKQRFPQCHRADFNGTTLLLTTQMPTLRHGRIETGFEWEEFGKAIREDVG